MKITFYAGNQGPHFFDDTSTYRAGPWAGQNRVSFITEGQVRIGGLPTHSENVPRLKELNHLKYKAYFFSGF